MMDENKQILLKFKQYLVTTNYSMPRIIKYLDVLSLISRIVNKPFTEYNNDDIYAIVEHYQCKCLTDNIKVSYYALIKRFYITLYNPGSQSSQLITTNS